MMFRLPTLILLLFAITTQTGVPQDEETDNRRGYLPVGPKVLLDSLPDKVDGYALKKSRGFQGMAMWMESVATREFLELPKKEDGETKSKPKFTRISLKDTAKYKGGDIDLFQNFTPASYPEDGYEYLYINKSPAIIINDKKRSEIEAQLLVNKRFILKILIRNQKQREIAKWVRRVKTSQLNAIKDGPKKPLPEDLTSITIDQLNPEKSSKSVASASLLEAPADPDETIDDPKQEEMIEE